MLKRFNIFINILILFTYINSILSGNCESKFAPIDIVYLWVDGSDPDWLAIKNQYLNKSGDAVTDNRFADHEELRYSMRSIYKYAPFFNHIYIVTMNQKPKWLIDHPKVTIIDHKQIFKKPEYLPTFNSQALESNLHRIPGLSENFIYFNDDVFLGTPISISDFFNEDNKIKVLFTKSLSPSGPPTEKELQNPNSNTSYRKAWRNTNAFLDNKYKKERRYRLKHAPFGLRKSLIEMAEKEFGEIFDSNSSHKFRSDYDYNITNGLLQYYWHYNNLIEPGTISNIMISIKNDNFIAHNKREFEKLTSGTINSFCIQDCFDKENSENSKLLLKNFLESYFPEPAPWEDIY